MQMLRVRLRYQVYATALSYLERVLSSGNVLFVANFTAVI